MPKVRIKNTPKAANGKSITPLDSDTVQFNGPSHKRGGMDISYGDKSVEVEGGETGYLSDVDNSFHIMGNMINPLSGKKFKADSKTLAKKEKKIDNLLNLSTKLVNESNPYDKWDQLRFNSGMVMMKGSITKKKEIGESKEWLATLQNAMLEKSEEMGADPQEFSKGRLKQAKNGAKIYKNGGDPWDFRGTNTKNLDKKIMEFVKLLEKKGYTGYSGEQSGYSKRNTKSGRLSRHAANQALDLFFEAPDAYNKILKDPELSGFLINNGLTAINEYDPEVAKGTGATAGHIHIGYDKGTPTANDFRSKAANLYKKDNPNWSWGKTDGPGKGAQKGLPYGDVYNNDDFSDQIKKKYKVDMSNDPEMLKKIRDYKEKYNPNRVQMKDYIISLQDPKHYDKPTNRKGLSFDQILPELYTFATNKEEPVWMQQYNPQLFQPYQVSFQDRINENSSTFNALEKSQSDNPSALATLAAQKYMADSQVHAEEFRTNQAIEQDVVNKNIGLLNDAGLKNLSLADTQYVRQAQAKSITKGTNRAVLSSIADKLQQNRYEQLTQGIYENLYPHYSFNTDSGAVQKVGAPGQEYIDWEGMGDSYGKGDSKTTNTYDQNGKLKQTRITDNPDIDNALKYQRYNKEQEPTIIQRLRKKDNLIPLINYPHLRR